MRHALTLSLFCLAWLSGCASTVETASAPAEPQRHATVQMTVVAGTLAHWPYNAPVTFFLPDDHLVSQEQGKPWLPLFKDALIARLQALGLQPATSQEQANVLVSLGVLGDKEQANNPLFASLGMDPGANGGRNGTLALILRDQQSNTVLWRGALQASSDMPLTAKAARSHAAQTMITQLTYRLPGAQ